MLGSLSVLPCFCVCVTKQGAAFHAPLPLCVLLCMLLSVVMCVLLCMQVGIMGLVEDGWLETLGAVNPADLVYQDFVTVGRQLASYLKVGYCCVCF